MKTFKVLLIFTVLVAPMTAYAGIDSDLIKAAKNGDLAKVKVLLDKGADIDAREKGFLIKSLNTPLMLASYNGRKKVVEELLKRGASVFLMNSYGGTALILAAWKGHADIARALVEKGADVNAQTNKGTTALMKASMHGYPSVAKLLIEKGANINMQANDGWTALMYTARYGQKAISKVLLEKGADASATSDKGKTALTIATNAREFQIAQLLKNPPRKKTKVAKANSNASSAGSASSVSSGSSGSGDAPPPGSSGSGQNYALKKKKMDEEFVGKYKVEDFPPFAQLSGNPFIYKGKTIGVHVEFEMMNTQSAGVFTNYREGILGNAFLGTMIISSLPGLLFTYQGEVALVAAKVLGDIKYDGGTGISKVPHLSFIGAYFCADEYCSEVKPK